MVVATVAAAAETTAGSAGMMTSDAAENLNAFRGTCSLKFDDEQELCVAISRNFAHRQ